MSNMLSKIKPAQKVERKLKMIAWGASGTGKSSNCLSAEGPVLCIDTEEGVAMYNEFYNFDTVQLRNYQEIKQLVNELIQCGATVNGKTYTSVILDSLTEIYRLLEDLFLTNLRLKTGNPSAQIEPLHYKQINGEFKVFTDMLLLLDTNVFCVAHSRQNYVSGEFMKINQMQPFRPDLPEKAMYYFDVVVNFVKKGDKYSAIVDKSRLINPTTGRSSLPAAFSDIDNHNFIPELMKYVRNVKQAPELPSNSPKNVALSSVEITKEPENVDTIIPIDMNISIDDIKKQIYAKVTELKLSKTKLQEISLGITGKASSNDFTLEEAITFLEHISGMEN